MAQTFTSELELITGEKSDKILSLLRKYIIEYDKEYGIYSESSWEGKSVFEYLIGRKMEDVIKYGEEGYWGGYWEKEVRAGMNNKLKDCIGAGAYIILWALYRRLRKWIESG